MTKWAIPQEHQKQALELLQIENNARNVLWKFLAKVTGCPWTGPNSSSMIFDPDLMLVEGHDD